MCEDLEHAKELGAAGFVTGVLTEQHTVDKARMRVIVSLAKDKEVTFHRALDQAGDISEALEQVIAVGCGRVLTSGGKPTVRQGVSTIVELVRKAAGRIRIAAGGGVSAGIATRLRRKADVDLHASLRRQVQPGGSSSRDPLWRRGQEPAEVLAADVRELAAIVHSA
jgi:copper homeostasis protein